MPHVPGHVLSLVPIPLQLSQEAVDRLTVLKDAYNAENAAALTLAEWITLHLRELAIGREWSAAVEQRQAQLQSETNSAIWSERERLLGLV